MGQEVPIGGHWTGGGLSIRYKHHTLTHMYYALEGAHDEGGHRHKHVDTLALEQGELASWAVRDC